MIPAVAATCVDISACWFRYAVAAILSSRGILYMSKPPISPLGAYGDTIVCSPNRDGGGGSVVDDVSGGGYLGIALSDVCC